MRILVFDTETTGLPERGCSIYDCERWPHIVQLSFILYDTHAEKALAIHDYIIRIPSDIDISKESTMIHGITNTMCKRKGIPIELAMEEFNEYLEKCDMVVGHNIDFDKKMIIVESLRNKLKNSFISYGQAKSLYCTMKTSVILCAIQKTNKDGKDYFKYPSLTELYMKLFDEEPKNTHNSMADVLICLRCYMKIKHNTDILKTTDNVLKKVYKQQCC